MVHYFANSIKSKNNNKSSDIKKMNNINLNLDPVFGRSKSERTLLSLTQLKDADLPVGMDSIINQNIENNGNNDINDNNRSNGNNNPSSNIDALSKRPVYSSHLIAHDDLDIKLKNVSTGDISTTDFEIDSNDIDSDDIGADVESVTGPTGSKLTQANASILQSLLLSPKNESKSISFDAHKGVSSRHETFGVVYKCITLDDYDDGKEDPE